MANETNNYYASEAWHGYGTQWLIGKNDGSPETFSAVAFVSSISPGDMSTAVIDKTHLRSPEAHREKLAGLRDSGAFTVTGHWVPTHESQSNAGGGTGAFAAGGLMYLWRTRAERNMKFVLTDTGGSPATEWPFRGVITKFQPGEIGPDDKVDFTCEVTPLQDFSADLP